MLSRVFISVVIYLGPCLAMNHYIVLPQPPKSHELVAANGTFIKDPKVAENISLQELDEKEELEKIKVNFDEGFHAASLRIIEVNSSQPAYLRFSKKNNQGCVIMHMETDGPFLSIDLFRSALENTPLGRIVIRITKDVYLYDNVHQIIPTSWVKGEEKFNTTIVATPDGYKAITPGIEDKFV